MIVRSSRSRGTVVTCVKAGEVFQVNSRGYTYIKIRNEDCPRHTDSNAYRVEDGALCNLAAGDIVTVFPDAALWLEGEERESEGG